MDMVHIINNIILVAFTGVIIDLQAGIVSVDPVQVVINSLGVEGHLALESCVIIFSKAKDIFNFFKKT